LAVVWVQPVCLKSYNIMQDKEDGKQHKNDMYGNIASRDESDEGVAPPIPSATVVLLRDRDEGVEVLMLKKNSKITFGGMWVFPGGKIDAADQRVDEDSELGARRAAVREAQEEASINLDAGAFHYFSHWTPPPGPQKRFTTWFFAANANGANHEVEIDDGEIKAHSWLNPANALVAHAKGEIDVVPPTWVTLYHLSQHATVGEFFAHLQSRPVHNYSTRVVKDANDERVAMWAGDAGYENWDADLAGERHRLVMGEGGFEFENSVVDYTSKGG
jgi:8-oxo-dGTP pyrophosphatase MutT (NUDIX family)